MRSYIASNIWLSAIICEMTGRRYALPMPNPKPTRALQEADKFIVRLPEGMRDVLKARAASNNRSMNAEIVAILSDATSGDSSLGAVSVEALLKAVADRMGTAVQIIVAPDVAEAAGIAPVVKKPRPVAKRSR